MGERPFTDSPPPPPACQDASPGSGDPGDPGQAPRLTPVEWAVLEPLLRRPGQLVDTAELVSDVWGGRFRLTERGMGYRYLP